MSKSKELGKSLSALTEEEKAEIVCHIMQAKNRKAQLQIEADLHATTKDVIKEVMKEGGISLKIFNGGKREKKGIKVGLGDDNKGESWTPAADEHSQDWQDLAIPPVEVELDCQIITDVQDIPRKEVKLPEQVRYKKPEIIDGPPEKDEDDKELEGIKQKIDKLLQRRAELCAELDIIDTRLRKYTFFYEDLYDELGKAGVEI